MKFFMIIFFSIICLKFSFAWDGKISTGQVLSNNEGEEGVHDFASPSEQAKLMENYADGGDQVGVFNNNLFIMQDDGIINVPMGEITGIGKEELNEVINEAFVEYEVKTVKKYVEMPPEDIAKIEAIDEDTAKELISRSKENLIKEKEEVAKKLKELGVEESLINLKGMTQGMVVTLGQKNIKKLSDFADLSSDELIGGFDEIKGKKIRIDGYLEEFLLSKDEADQLIMSARDIVYK